MWPWRRGRESRPAPIPKWTPGDQWRSVPPIQRLVPDHPLVNPVSRFTSSLASWQNPSSLAPLGHSVDAAEPSGVVSDLATPLPDLPLAVTPQSARPARSGGGVWSRVVSTVTGSGPVVQRAVAAPEPVLEHEVQPAEPTAEPTGESTEDPPAGPVMPEMVVPGPVRAVPSSASAEVDVRPRELPVVRDAPARPDVSVQRIEELGLWESAPAAEPSTAAAEVLGVRHDEPAVHTEATEVPQVTEPDPVRRPETADPAPDLAKADRPITGAEPPAARPVAQRTVAVPPPVRKLGLGEPIVSSAAGAPPPAVPPAPAMQTVHSDPVQRSMDPPGASPPVETTTAPPVPGSAELLPEQPVTRTPATPMVVSRLVGDRSPVAVDQPSGTVHTEQPEPGIAGALPAITPTVARLSTTEEPRVQTRPERVMPNPVTGSRTVAGLGAPSFAPTPMPIQRSQHVLSATSPVPPRPVSGTLPAPTMTTAPELPPVVQREESEPVPAEAAPTGAALPEVPAAPAQSPAPDAAAPAPPSATAAAPAAPGAPGAPGQAGQEPEELLKKLFDPLLRRLKTELRLDRERRGALTDRWH
jgi:hypothetical protein